jgi:hypothetical protein
VQRTQLEQDAPYGEKLGESLDFFNIAIVLTRLEHDRKAEFSQPFCEIPSALSAVLHSFSNIRCHQDYCKPELLEIGTPGTEKQLRLFGGLIHMVCCRLASSFSLSLEYGSMGEFCLKNRSAAVQGFLVVGNVTYDQPWWTSTSLPGHGVQTVNRFRQRYDPWFLVDGNNTRCYREGWFLRRTALIWHPSSMLYNQKC